MHCCAAALSTSHQRPVLACRVMIHASYGFRVNSVGIEFDSVKVQKADSMVQHAFKEVAKGRWPLLLQAQTQFQAPITMTANIDKVCEPAVMGLVTWHGTCVCLCLCMCMHLTACLHQPQIPGTLTIASSRSDNLSQHSFSALCCRSRASQWLAVNPHMSTLFGKAGTTIQSKLWASLSRTAHMCK